MTKVEQAALPSTDSGEACLEENRRTLLVLGASNVSLAWSEIASLAIQCSNQPVDLVTAQGMGRAYVTAQSGFAFCRLPGILHSGLWNAFADQNQNENPNPPSSVLMTDLGNDLLYGRSVSEVLDGAMQCIVRIRECSPNADVVLTAPPLASVLQLGSIRFKFFKQVLFPFSTLDLRQVKQATEDLCDGVQQIAAEEAIKLYVPQKHCFGFDPIHVRRRNRRDVFRSMMALWEQPPCSEPEWKRFRKVIPQRRLMMGREKLQPQPTLQSQQLRIFAY